MIITRTPFRISFFGGGTDYPAWYRKNGGAVLSATIDKYCYLLVRHLPPFFEYRYRVRYSTNENVLTHDEIEHPSVRESLKYFNFTEGVEIVHTADLPAMSGLGSSSSFTVGLVHALAALRGEELTKQQLAERAIEIEQERIKENVGSQDQVAAAFGNVNTIEFSGNTVSVRPVAATAERLRELEGDLLLFFTGFSRRASEIAAEQVKAIPQKAKELTRMREMVSEGRDILEGDGSLDDFGSLLHEAWTLKRALSPIITNEHIDAIYEKGRTAGALGGKLLGAGSGGFMLFYVPKEKQSAVRRALKDLLHVPFHFEPQGSHIILQRPSEKYEIVKE